jgi:hypothetical protein
MPSKVDSLMTFYTGLGFIGSLADKERQFLASKAGYQVGKSNADNQKTQTTDHIVRSPLDPTKVP